jgi:hypothetical protein
MSAKIGYEEDRQGANIEGARKMASLEAQWLKIKMQEAGGEKPLVGAFSVCLLGTSSLTRTMQPQLLQSC